MKYIQIIVLLFTIGCSVHKNNKSKTISNIYVFKNIKKSHNIFKLSNNYKNIKIDSIKFLFKKDSSFLKSENNFQKITISSSLIPGKLEDDFVNLYVIGKINKEEENNYYQLLGYIDTFKNVYRESKSFIIFNIDSKDYISSSYFIYNYENNIFFGEGFHIETVPIKDNIFNIKLQKWTDVILNGTRDKIYYKNIFINKNGKIFFK